MSKIAMVRFWSLRRSTSDALAKFGNWSIEIVKRPAAAPGFKLLPRHWVTLKEHVSLQSSNDGIS
jgi:hypothetical protein